MNLRDIKLRMRGVRKTQQITRAMKMVAAVKFRQAQARLLKSRPYAERMAALTAHALHQRRPEDASHPFLQVRPLQRLLVVVMAADKGLCGSFNTNIYRAVGAFLREQAALAPAPQVDLVLVGRKINDLFKRFSQPGLAVNIRRYWPRADVDHLALGQELMALFQAAQYDRIDAFFTEFKSAMQNHIVRRQLLPLEIAPLEETPELLLEPGWEDLLAELLPHWLLVSLQQLLMETEASEQGTRMSMMDQATRNADELLEQLLLDQNKARQWGITRELLDITTGAEAMA